MSNISKHTTTKDDYELILKKYKEDFLARSKDTKALEGKKYSYDNFVTYKTIGVGAFGHVVLVKDKSSDTYYAMKIMKKGYIVQKKQVTHVLNEKKILLTIRFPFLLSAKCAFQSKSFIFFVMPFLSGGEMFTYLRKFHYFHESLSKFYAAQVVLALEYLHFLNLVYRDLKPENILIDNSGYIKLIDFGFVKMLSQGRTYTFCGTPEYIAPEIILQKGYNQSVDWWSFGILIYEMCNGYPPFTHQDPMAIYDKILSNRPKYPTSFSFDLKDLIKNLLQADLSRRFGNLRNGAKDIKDHKWFVSINFMDVYNRSLKPPFMPTIKKEADTTNFDEYTDVDLKEDPKADEYADQFKDF